MDYLALLGVLLEQYRTATTLAALAGILVTMVGFWRARRAYRRATAEVERHEQTLLAMVTTLEEALTYYAKPGLYIADEDGAAVIFGDNGATARAVLATLNDLLEVL